MLQDVAHYWWLMLLRGIAAIAFGILAWMWPGITLLVLLMFYAAYCLIEGVSALFLGFSGRKEEGRRVWWQMVLIGLLGIAAAVITVIWPNLTALVLLIVIASWAIVRGIFEIAAAIRLRKEIRGEWMLVLSGILSILLGIALLIRPDIGLLALVWLIGVFSVASGAILIALSLKLRKLRELPPGEIRPAMGT